MNCNPEGNESFIGTSAPHILHLAVFPSEGAESNWSLPNPIYGVSFNLSPPYMNLNLTAQCRQYHRVVVPPTLTTTSPILKA